jgi:hypothetical protein
LQGGISVYLLYTVPKMNTFYGIAKYVSFDTSRQKLSAVIEWIFKNTVPYKKVRFVLTFFHHQVVIFGVCSHLRNPLNNNRLIYDGLDGQVVDMGIAMKLWDLFVESGRPLYKSLP